MERKNLTNFEINAIFKKFYGISIFDIERQVFPYATIYIIFTEEGKYLLREHEDSVNEKDLKEEVKIIEFLKVKNIPTESYIKTKDGNYLVEHKERKISVKRYVEGKTYDFNFFDLEKMLLMGDYLGKIVCELKNTQTDFEDNITNWLDEKYYKKSIRSFKNLIKESKTIENEKIRKDIIKDLKYKIKIANIIIEDKGLIEKMKTTTHLLSHGDYTSIKLVFDKGEFKQVLDFSSARKLPIVWEIIRSYTSMDKECIFGNINIENLIKYTKEFLKHQKLTNNDLALMPYVYMYQLCFSSYGYSQYLGSSNEEMLKQGVFRTNLLRWLYNNAHILKDRLINDIKRKG